MLKHHFAYFSAVILIFCCGLLCSCGYLNGVSGQSAPEPTETSHQSMAETPPSADAGDNGPSASQSGNTAIYETPNFSLPVDMEPEEKIYALTLSSPRGPFIYYNQLDSRWSGYLYGGSDPMRKYGCGPTVLAMFASSFTTTPMTPAEAADWAAERGFWAPSHGSLHSIIPDGLEGLGMQVESVPATLDDLKSSLSSGKILVTLMGRGTFTQIGHFLVITELHEDGTVSIADPASYNNTLVSWDPNIILEELKRGSGDGGPLWSVSIPSATAP